jgi:cytochrome c-type biogenesis protein CcmE
VSKPTISFSGMTFDLDEVQNHFVQMPGLNVVEFDLNKIKHAEMSIEFKWAQPDVFSVGQLVRIEGHLCKVVSVAKDGSVTFEKVEEAR